MIFDTIAATLGGIAKDIQVACIATGDFIVEEVSSIPAAFSAGYDHGLVSSTTPDTPPVIEEQPKQPTHTPFSEAA